MAALPTALQVKARAQSRADRADDIARLKSEIDLPELDYVDICAQIELQKTLQRWPLLAEVERLRTAVLAPTRKPEREVLS